MFSLFFVVFLECQVIREVGTAQWLAPLIAQDFF